MKRLPPDAYKIRNNNLIVVWRIPRGKTLRQGKRVRKSCRLTREEIRAYVKHDRIVVTRMIKDRLGCTLDQAWNLFNQECGPNRV